MLSLPAAFSTDASEKEVQEMKINLDTAEKILHQENIYFCRLQTAYMQICGSKNRPMKPELQKMVYDNYKRLEEYDDNLFFL